MTYEVYRYIFMAGAILSGLMLIVSVLLFIFLKIPKVIADLTGATAKKAIKEIRKQNESTGSKTYKSSLVNSERGKLTDKISPSGSLLRNPSGSTVGAMATEKISTDELVTGPLSEETTLLNESVTNETTLLSQIEEVDVVFKVEYEITYIHTDEIIA